MNLPTIRHKKSGKGITEPKYDSDSKNRNSRIRIKFSSDFDYQHSISKKFPSTFIFCSSNKVLLATKSIAMKMKLWWIKRLSKGVLFLCFLLSINNYLYYLFMLAIALVLSSTLLTLVIRLTVAKYIPFLNFLEKYSSCTPVVWYIACVKGTNESNNIYEGEYYQGKKTGSGVHYNKNVRYEGDWIGNRYDGFGAESLAIGTRYRGQFRLGLRHGLGVFWSDFGDVYEGEWLNGLCHGYGVQTSKDGKYCGDFKTGQKHGIGQYHFRNGDLYAGEYFAEKIHGFGVYYFVNGHRYEGGWHEGKMQGFGVYKFENGDTESGHWDNNVLMPVSPTRVCKAVEEARRLANKAESTMNVQEKTTSAMATANRAAYAARVSAIKAVHNRVLHFYDPI